MSVRYGVVLIPEASFTARAYRARQIICGQYGSWAAEMQLLHLSLASYFQCPDQALEGLSQGLAGVAQRCRRRVSRFPLHSRGVQASEDAPGDIFLDFTVPDNPTERHQRELDSLHREVIALLEDSPGVLPDLRAAREKFHPCISLMQHASLPPAVFDSAVMFARAVVRDLQLPSATRAWQMMLVRYASEAAGDDWGGGRWASDLQWRILATYAL